MKEVLVKQPDETCVQQKRLNGPDAARYIGVKTCTLAKWRQQGCGPRYSAKLPRGPRYNVDDLESWLRASMVENTAQAKALRSKH